MSDAKMLGYGGVEYYPVVKNSDGSVSIDGKEYADSLIGKMATVPEGTYAYSADLTNTGFLKKSDSIGGLIGQIIGELTFQGTKYVVTSGDYIEGFFKVSDVKIQNGGVQRSPLTHLYQSLQALLNRKVVAYGW